MAYLGTTAIHVPAQAIRRTFAIPPVYLTMHAQVPKVSTQTAVAAQRTVGYPIG